MPLLVILLAGQAMASMDGEILVIAAPSLRADLHASGAQLQLIVGMYTLAFGALVVTGARLGDVLGYRRVFLLGLTAFTLASLAAGLAPTPSVLIGAVGLQGAAAALMTPQVLSIIQQQFAGETRARAIGAYSMVLAAGVATGMVLGGLLVTAHLLAAAWRPALAQRPSDSQRPLAVEGALEPDQQRPALEQQRVLGDPHGALDDQAVGIAIEEEVRRALHPDRGLAVDGQALDRGGRADDLAEVVGAEVAAELADERSEPGAAGARSGVRVRAPVCRAPSAPAPLFWGLRQSPFQPA